MKTAIFGGDANWGRILQTLGAAGVALRLDLKVARKCVLGAWWCSGAEPRRVRRRAGARPRAS